jgi:hypothetical protein
VRYRQASNQIHGRTDFFAKLTQRGFQPSVEYEGGDFNRNFFVLCVRSAISTAPLGSEITRLAAGAF